MLLEFSFQVKSLIFVGAMPIFGDPIFLGQKTDQSLLLAPEGGPFFSAFLVKQRQLNCCYSIDSIRHATGFEEFPFWTSMFLGEASHPLHGWTIPDLVQ